MSLEREELLQRIRQRFTLAALWQVLKLPGEVWTNLPLRSPFRLADSARTFVIKGPAMWVDHRDGSSGDTLTLLCRLRGCDPNQPAAAVVDEFLSLGARAGLIRPDELPADEPECQNVGMSEPPSARPDVIHFDTFRAGAREEKVAESGPVMREAEMMGIDGPYARAKKVRKKAPMTCLR